MEEVLDDFINMIEVEKLGYIPSDSDLCKLNVKQIKAFVNI